MRFFYQSYSTQVLPGHYQSLCVPILEMMRGHKALGVHLDDSHIMGGIGCLGDVMSPGMLLYW